MGKYTTFMRLSVEYKPFEIRKETRNNDNKLEDCI